MNIAIIQARVNSNRLPCKVLMPMAGKSVLENIINKISESKKIDEIYVATGYHEVNKPIRLLCFFLNVKCYSGSNDNVLHRFVSLLRENHCNMNDNIVRITADCLFIDPQIIDNMLGLIKDKPYLGNQKNMIDGSDIEIIKAKCLFDALDNYLFDEHVTLKWKYNNKHLITYYDYDKDDKSDIHLSLDTLEDYHKIKNIYENLYKLNPYFSYNDLLNELKIIGIIK